jgi:hypothetical protein
MTDFPADQRATLTQYGHEHLLVGWDQLTDSQQARLIAQLRTVPFAELAELNRRE